jgi:hypothetical protein
MLAKTVNDNSLLVDQQLFHPNGAGFSQPQAA